MRARDRQRARRAARQTPSRLAPDGLPIPPAELIVQVIGMPSEELFLTSGANAHQIITETLARHSIDVERLTRLLDFGVGCGRIARHWTGIETEVHGCDYNPALVAWCQENLRHVKATRNRLDPPLPYEDGSFDFIYALSVFTHLTESQQHAWIAELRRVVRIGGTVLFTTHGPTFPHQDPTFRTPEVAARLECGELLVIDPDHAGSNRCGTLHPRSWVERNMLNGFELLEYAERGGEIGSEMNGGQDIYLVRRLR
jgi:SAM-dependent methyltransferase